MPLTRFDQGFEADTSGLIEYPGTITIEPGAGGGSVARLEDGGVFTRFDGYRSLGSETERGFTTSVDVYLDPGAWEAGEGFDYSVAANSQSGVHLRDFIFYVTEDTSTGELLVGVGTGSNFAPRENLESGMHAEISEAGWYTLEHTFAESDEGTLEVTMSVVDSQGMAVFTQVIAAGDSFDDFGGNRYGWFTHITVDEGIEVDNLTLSTENTDPVEVRNVGGTIIGQFGTIEEAQAAIDVGDIAASVLSISTNGQEGSFFYVAEGMSIQAAVDAASAGDTIILGEGVHDENLIIGVSVTIEGANAGLSYDDEARSSESEINGSILVSAADVTIDGISLTEGGGVRGEQAGIYVDAVNATITNSILDGSDGTTPNRGILTPYGERATGLTVSNTDFNGWSTGIFLNGQDENMSIIGNDLNGNSTGLSSDGPVSGSIADNFFGTAGLGIGAMTGPETVDIGALLGEGNIFTRLGADVGIYALSSGSQTITGTIHDDVVFDNAQANVISTGLGDDRIVASGGNDTLDGGEGADTYDASNAGSSGILVDLASGVSFSAATGFDQLTSIENVIGSVGNDALFGNAGDNVFVASGGTDVIDGRGGSDDFDASAATTDITADLQAGAVSGGANATLTSIENISTGSGNDNVTGSSADNVISTGAGNDTVTASAGDDIVDGGAGMDAVAFAGARDGYTIEWDGTTAVVTHTASGDTTTITDAGQLTFGAGSEQASVFLVAGDSDEFTTIQSAVDAADDGDQILVAAGTYAGATIDCDVTISGVNSGVLGYDELSTSGEPRESEGETILTSGFVVLEDVTTTIDGLRFENTTAINTNTGFLAQHVTFINNVIVGGANQYFGNAGELGTILISGNFIESTAGNGLQINSFGNGVATVTNNLFDGTGPGAAAVNANGLAEFTFTDNVVLNTSSHGVQVAGLMGDVTIESNTFDSTVQSGASDRGAISVSNPQDFTGILTITGNTVTNSPFGIAYRGSSDADSTAGPSLISDNDFSGTTVSPFGHTGNSLDNTLTGGTESSTFRGFAGNDNFVVGGGDDIVDGGAGMDTVAFAGGRDGYTIDWDGTTAVVTHTETGDMTTITDAGQLTFGSGLEQTSAFLVAGESDEYATIQSAVDASQDGDEIILAAGTYTENVTVTTDLTLTGANAGIRGDGERSAESLIVGFVDINANGVTVDGVAVQDGGRILGQDVGIYVRGDNLTITNSVLDRDGGANGDGFRGIITTLGGGDGLTVTESAFSGWATGIFANSNGIADITATGNVFDGNFVSISIDGPASGNVSDNNFINSGFEHVGIGVLPTQTEADIGEIIGDNDFDASQSPITIYALGNGQTITGTDNDDRFIGTYGGTDNTFEGGAGDDTFEGGAGDDTFITDLDDSDINGGGGADTVVFAADVTVEDVMASEDVFTDVEVIRIGVAGEGATFVVFEGMSIQDAVDSALPGDTIQIAAGTFNEDVTVPVSITILGANMGTVGDDAMRGDETIFQGRLTVTGDGVTIDGLAFDIDNSGAGGGNGVVTLAGADGSLINALMVQSADTGTVPFAVVITGEGNTVGDTLIDRGGAAASGAIGNPAISVSGVDAVTITGNTIIQGIIGIVTGDGTSDSVGLTLTDNTITASAANPDSIFVTGPGFGPLPAGFAPLAETIDLTGTIFTTEAGLQLRGTNGADAFGGFATGGNDLFIGADGDDFFTGSAGNDTFTGGAGTNMVDYGTSAQSVFVNLAAGSAFGVDIGSDALSGIQNVTGGSGADVIFGNTAANVLEGGAGNDQLFGAAGNDTFIVTAGNNQISGGAGTDAAVFENDWLSYTITDLGGGNLSVSDGTFTNTLTGVETFIFDGVAYDLSTVVNQAPDDIAFLVPAPVVEENDEGAIVTIVQATDPNIGDTQTFTVDDARFEVVELGGSMVLRLVEGESLGRDDEPVTVTVTVTDAGGLSRSEQLSIGVTQVNLPPTGGSLTDGWTPNSVEAGSIAGVLAPDADVIDPDGDPLTYTLTTAPSSGLLLRGTVSLDFSSPTTLAASIAAATIQVGDELTAAEFAAIVYNAPETAGDATAQFSVSDGEFSETLTVDLNVGAGQNEVIVGGNTGEILDGASGNDDITGGLGSDSILGGSGDDLISGGGGDDFIFGGTGNDNIRGDAGADTIFGISGANILRGGTGNDIIEGGTGNDTIAGNDDDDVISGGTGNDQVFGGDGNDLIRGDVGNDILIGGVGNDTIAGNDGNDLIRGDAGTNRLFGGSGDDTIEGGTGSDVISGSAGQDLLIGGLGTDILSGGTGSDVFQWRSADESMHSSQRDTVTDFQSGIDHIDLSGIMPGLTFVGMGGTELYTGTAGEVRYADFGNGTGRLYIDLTGNEASDFSIDFSGDLVLTGDDFIF